TATDTPGRDADALVVRAATEAQRRRLLALRADGTIGDAAFQRVEEELDWAELDWVQLVRAGRQADGEAEHCRNRRGASERWNRMRIGILGSGLMGAKLGTIFARAGHEVVFSYARSEQRLKELAGAARGQARAGTPREAAEAADAVLLAVHWS